MNKIFKFARSFYEDEQGSTAIEYGLIGALVAVAIIASLQNFAGSSNSMWNRVTNTIAENL